MSGQFVELNAELSGTVQGVGFRAYVSRVAKQHSISGWVKNTPEGTVKLKAYGTKDNVERFFNMAKKGPSMSNVTNVDFDYKDAVDPPKDGFDITF